MEKEELYPQKRFDLPSPGGMGQEPAPVPSSQEMPLEEEKRKWVRVEDSEINNPERAEENARKLSELAAEMGVPGRLVPHGERANPGLEIRSERHLERRAVFECWGDGEILLTLWKAERWMSRSGLDENDEEVMREALRSAWNFVDRVYDPTPQADSAFFFFEDPCQMVGREEEEARRRECKVVWALNTCKIDEGARSLERRRTVGFFDSLEEAHRILQDNVMDIEEAGHYPHAFLEKIALNVLYGVSSVRLWYAFDSDFEGYRPVPKPEGF